MCRLHQCLCVSLGFLSQAAVKHFLTSPLFPTRQFSKHLNCVHDSTLSASMALPSSQNGRQGARKGRTACQKRKSLPKQSSPNSNRSGRLRRASWRGHCFGWLVHCQIPSLPIQAVFPTYYLWYIYFYHNIFSAGQSSLTLSENCFAKRQQMVEAIHYPILYSCLISPQGFCICPFPNLFFHHW